MSTAAEAANTTVDEKSHASQAIEKTIESQPEEVSESKASNAGTTGEGQKNADNDDYERYDGGEKKPHKGERKEYKDRNNGNNRRGDKFGGGRGGRGGRGGGRGNGGKNHRYNVKTRFDRRPETDDLTGEIRRQVEFYFSDSNLPVDRFLLGEVGGTENKPVPLKTIHNFKRMRGFEPFSVVVKAVKTSNFLQVNDQDEVSRKQPIAKEFTLDVEKNAELLTDATMKRSVYVKGFGREGEKTAFEIEEFFQPYGAKSVRLRRADDKTFKGSVFVEFVDEETAQNFLDLEEKPRFLDNELLVKSKKAYVDEKNEAIKNGDVRPRSPNRQRGDKFTPRYNRRDNNRRENKKRGRNDDDDLGEDWRERRARDSRKRRKDDDDGDDDNDNEDGDHDDRRAVEEKNKKEEEPAQEPEQRAAEAAEPEPENPRTVA